MENVIRPGYGSGWGDGSGYGISVVDGRNICNIDSIPTAIDHIHGNVAKGAILNPDLAFTPCWVVRQDGKYAHGEDLHKAMQNLRDKIFEDMPEEARIAAFVDDHIWGELYSIADLSEWHHLLTGSCDMGRETFAKAHGLTICEEEKITVEEFISLTKNSYGGDIITAIEAQYSKKRVRKDEVKE